jgi:glycosyltransferase involved in cell wall biosynthesis
MPTEPAQKLVVVHYHFRPGGVRRVMELLLPELAKRFQKITLVGGEHPDAHWGLAMKRKIPRLRFVIAPAFGYFDAGAPERMRGKIRGVLQREAGPDAMIWAHNLSLGRNMILADELAVHSARTGTRLVSHHHDFWCDHRWARWPEMRAQGFRTLSDVARAAFAADARVLHAGINSSDVRLLSRHMKSAAWLPNPAGGEARPGRAAISHARRWLRDELGDDAPVWIYPARFLRRKNFAEAILLARWLSPEAWLLTTGGISSPGESAYANRLIEAARKGRWRVRFGILAGREAQAPSVPELIGAAESAVMTSIQEGFGFPYFEGAGLGCRVIARKLPAIHPDLKAFGLGLPGLYDEVLIPPGLFDAKAELLRQRTAFRSWKTLLPCPCRALAEAPQYLSQPGSPVPFSRLTLEAQLEVLTVPPRESLAACSAWNPKLGAPARADWVGAAALSPAACAERFFERAVNFPATRPTALQTRNTQQGIIKERLGRNFLFPLLMQG